MLACRVRCRGVFSLASSLIANPDVVARLSNFLTVKVVAQPSGTRGSASKSWCLGKVRVGLRRQRQGFLGLFDFGLVFLGLLVG